MASNGNKKNGTSKKRQEQGADREFAPSLSPEVARGVAAIFFVVLAGLLVLAGAGHAGPVGAWLYRLLSELLGVGYVLLPLSFVLLAAIVFRSFEKAFGYVQIASVAFFLLASLGLVNVALPGKGGALGGFITGPLIAGLDVPATAIFLLAVAVASIVVAFNVHIGALISSIVAALRSREESAGFDESAEPIVAVLPFDEPAAGEEEAPATPVREREPIAHPRALESEAEGTFPIIAASGLAYEPPPLSILAKNRGRPEVGDVKANMNIIKRTLQNFGIQVEMDEASIGPTVTRYALKPAEGVRLSKIIALQSNLELALAASPVRIEAPIPGKSLVGIEVPNIARTTLGLGPLLSEEGFAHSDRPLLVALGRSITGAPHFADLWRMPHLLVAGTTGAGKSVAIHDFIVSLLYRCGPERLRFIMVDPKRVELTLYNSIPHLLTPVITDAKKCILALKWLAKEMERRYNILEAEHVRDITSYHHNVVAPAIEKARGLSARVREEKMPEAMPYIVLIIDELADIISAYPRELEAGIVRLAQMSRAVGIHLILSTQRPSVKVITGLIKANIPARVALQVASQIDSRTILDMGGAEKLLGAGDMLFLSGEMSKPRRIQAALISESEVKRVVTHVAKNGEGVLMPEIDFTEAAKDGSGVGSIFSSFKDESEDDELYGQARQTIIEAGKASTSYLQRKLGIGYARAARLMDLLEERGVIGPADGAKPREVIGAGAHAQQAEEAEEESVFDA